MHRYRQQQLYHPTNRQYIERIYGEYPLQDGESDDDDDDDDIEAAIAKEVKGMKQSKKTDAIVPMDLSTPCVVFVRTRKPVDPVKLVMSICEDAKSTGINKTRYTQRLTPVTLTGTANLEGVERVAKEVLKPHFHNEHDQKPLKYAIRPTIRNHNTLSRDDIIPKIANCVGREHGHSVDLKQYDKLILVEVFKVCWNVGDWFFLCRIQPNIRALWVSV